MNWTFGMNYGPGISAGEIVTLHVGVVILAFIVFVFGRLIYLAVKK
jgi:hypothetical protein